MINLNTYCENDDQFVDHRKVGRYKMPEEEAQRRIKASQQSYYMRNREAILARAKQRYAEKKAQGLLPKSNRTYKKLPNPVDEKIQAIVRENEERVKETEKRMKEMEAMINSFKTTQISPVRDIPSFVCPPQPMV